MLGQRVRNEAIEVQCQEAMFDLPTRRLGSPRHDEPHGGLCVRLATERIDRIFALLRRERRRGVIIETNKRTGTGPNPPAVLVCVQPLGQDVFVDQSVDVAHVDARHNGSFGGREQFRFGGHRGTNNSSG